MYRIWKELTQIVTYTVQTTTKGEGAEKENQQDVDCKRYDKSKLWAWYDTVIGQEETLETISFLVDFMEIFLLRAQWHKEHRVY